MWSKPSKQALLAHSLVGHARQAKVEGCHIEGLSCEDGDKIKKTIMIEYKQCVSTYKGHIRALVMMATSRQRDWNALMRVRGHRPSVQQRLEGTDRPISSACMTSKIEGTCKINGWECNKPA
eukprot:1160456-Pelagomonas_calceolata.AAC.10